MDYILIDDVEALARSLDLYGMQGAILERLKKKDFTAAITMCSEAKMRCFQMTRTQSGESAQTHTANLNKIAELENLLERLERQQ